MKLRKAGLLFTWVWVAAGCSDTADPSPVGSLSVGVASSGASLDKDGYRLSIDGGAGSPVANTAQVQIPQLSVGSHQVELTGLAINCTVTGGNPRTVTVRRDAEATETFVVTCPLALDGHLVYHTALTDGHGYYGDIFVANPDGSGPVNLTNSDGFTNNVDPAVSPDATTIAYVTNNIVTLMAPDGSGQQPLSSPPGAVYQPRWSPDGGRLVLTVQNPGNAWDVYVTSRDGAAFIPLTAENFLSAAAMGWSPDGNEILIWATTGDSTSYNLIIARADGSGWRYLAQTTDHDFAVGWSPDGQKILFMRQSEPPAAYYRKLFSISPDGSGLTPLTGDSLEAGDDAAWSPDGGRIAFMASGTPGGQIYVMNADGSGVDRVGAASGQFVKWTRDGSRISFRRDGVGLTYDIFAIDADGSNLQNLTETTDQEVNFDWGPIR